MQLIVQTPDILSKTVFSLLPPELHQLILRHEHFLQGIATTPPDEEEIKWLIDNSANGRLLVFEVAYTTRGDYLPYSAGRTRVNKQRYHSSKHESVLVFVLAEELKKTFYWLLGLQETYYLFIRRCNRMNLEPAISINILLWVLEDTKQKLMAYPEVLLRYLNGYVILPGIPQDDRIAAHFDAVCDNVKKFT